MSRLLARRLAVGLAALLLAAPLAVESSASVLEQPEGDLFGAGDALFCVADPHARLLGLDESSVRGSGDLMLSSLPGSRSPPGDVR